MDWDPGMCRICFENSSESVELSTYVENNINWLSLYKECTQLDAFSDDCLPNKLCKFCSIDLLEAYRLKIKARNADKILRKHMHQFEPNDDEMTVAKRSHIRKEDIGYKEDSQSFPKETLYELHFDSENDQSLNVALMETKIDNSFCSVIKDHGNAKNKMYALAEQEHSYPDYLPYHCDTKLHLEIETNVHAVECDLSNKLIECTECGKKLKRTSLKGHWSRFHSSSISLFCNSCPKYFHTSSDLRTHMRTHDSSRQRKFKCPRCPKAFFEKQSLYVHILRHTGIKPFKCEVCAKVFTTKNALEAHFIVHDRGCGKFLCNTCQKTFASNVDLTIHTRFHTHDFPYECEHCSKRFAVKSHYNYHVAQHEGIMYECKSCSKQFKNRGSLRSHMFKHSDIKPHCCSICNKGMISPFALRQHMKKHQN